MMHVQVTNLNVKMVHALIQDVVAMENLTVQTIVTNQENGVSYIFHSVRHVVYMQILYRQLAACK